MITNMATSQNWKKKKEKRRKPWVTYLWILGAKLTNYFNKWFFMQLVFLMPDFSDKLICGLFFFPSGSWWRSHGWIFLLSTSTNLDFLELFRCCVFRQWKDLDHFIWFRSFWRRFYVIFSFPPNTTPLPPPPQISLCANLTHPKRKKKKKKKKREKFEKN